MYSYFSRLLFITAIIISFSGSTTYASNLTKQQKIIDNGKHIYLNGIGANENPIAATSVGNVKLSKDKASCVNCHRPSGYGSSEGGILIPSITANSLFNSREFKYKELKRKSTRPITRKSYNKSSLINAIKYGIDSNGRKLNPLMPRYNMKDSDMNNLISYLAELGTKTAPGVNDKFIHFSTIITPEVSEERKAAMLAVLNTYIKAKNAETRLEKRRASNSPWHKKWSYSAYRKWKFHVWELKGEKESWPKQLNTLYKNQPVFSIISGISTNSWQPIHEFCNSNKIPCLFPNTMLPGKNPSKVNTSQESYSLYFSEGIALEAKVIARHILNTNKSTPCSNIIQIIDKTNKTKIAANALSHQLLNYEIKTQSSVAVNNQDDFSNILLDNNLPTCVIHWASNPLIKNMKKKNSLNINKEYITNNVNKKLREKVINLERMIYFSNPFALNKDRQRHLKRIKVWSKMHKVSPYIEDVTANTYYAVTLTAKGIKHIRTHFSRDYFIERLEHMVDNMAFHSIYNRFTLGPGQRYASKGAYIIGPIKNPLDLDYKKDSEWITP